MSRTDQLTAAIVANRTPIALWTAGSLAAAVGLYFAVAWAWAQYTTWWADAGGFAHFQVWALVIGVAVAAVARLCGVSWGWTVALALGLPLVIALLMLRGAFQLVGASASTFD